MSELYNYYKEKKLKAKSNANSILLESKIGDEIDLLLKEYLVGDVEIHTFEVKPRVLEYVIEVIDKPPLSEKYTIWQTDPNEPTIFSARLKELEI